MTEGRGIKRPNWIIDGISVVVVALVAILLAFPNKIDLGPWTGSIPHVIGGVNSVTSVVLVLGFIFIRSGKVELHRYAMSTAFGLGVVFLVCYVTYHVSNPSKSFAGEGSIRILYLLVLASHILLSLVVLPLVLRAMYFAVTGQFEKHRRTAKFAFPTWLYVSVTGVVVYLLNHQFYA